MGEKLRLMLRALGNVYFLFWRGGWTDMKGNSSGEAEVILQGGSVIRQFGPYVVRLDQADTYSFSSEQIHACADSDGQRLG